jgi:hypothetical protein
VIGLVLNVGAAAAECFWKGQAMSGWRERGRADAGFAVDAGRKEENHQITRTGSITTTRYIGQMTDDTVNSNDGKMERVESRYVDLQALCG